MKQRLNTAALGLVSLAFASAAQAKLFSINARNYGSFQAYPEAKAQIDTMLNQLETEANKNLPEVDSSTFSKSMAQAGAMSNAGAGSDYSVPFRIISLGANVNVGADLGGNSIGDLIGGKIDRNKLPGAAPAAAIVVGFNPGVILKKPFADRMRVYLSYFSYDFSFAKGGFSSSSWGLHAKYKLIDTKGPRIARWDGVEIGTGIHHSSTTLTIKDSITQTQEATMTNVPGSPKSTAIMKAIINAGADISTTTIPFEISTGARVLFVLPVFTGLGMDLNFGSAKTTGNIDGSTLTITESSGTLTPASAQPAMDVGSKASPSAFGLRGFVGTGLDLAVLNIYVVLNKSLTNSSVWGTTIGVRAYF